MDSLPTNPYSSPPANPYSALGNSGVVAGDTVSAGVITQLAGTKPWVQFISVLLWLFMVMMFGFAAMMLMMGAVGLPMAQSQPSPFGTNAMGAGMMMGMAIYYCVLGLVMIYPALKTWKYGSRIGILKTTHSMVDLESALNEQRRFWKFHGIICIIVICLLVVSIVAVVSMAVYQASKIGGAGL